MAKISKEDESRLGGMLDRCLEALLEKDRHSYVSGLVQGLIHNINGPLQNMSMLVEMLLRSQEQLHQFACRDSGGDTAARDAAYGKQQKRLHQLSEQVSILTEMLRDFVVIQEIERNESEVDLNLLLTKLARVFRADLFFKHHVEVELRLADTMPLARVPGRHMVAAIIGLFRNALTAMQQSPRKRLIIECRVKDGNIEVAFTDTGCGLDDCLGEEVPFDLFSTYWPEEVLHKEKDVKHLGIGLYAARRLLAPYGAKVSLKRVEEGTSAVVEIPQAS